MYADAELNASAGSPFARLSQPEVFTYGGLIAHVLTFAARRRLLVLGALETAGISDLGSGDPTRWIETAA